MKALPLDPGRKRMEGTGAIASTDPNRKDAA
jgi:hypothetical protein